VRSSVGTLGRGHAATPDSKKGPLKARYRIRYRAFVRLPAARPVDRGTVRIAHHWSMLDQRPLAPGRSGVRQRDRTRGTSTPGARDTGNPDIPLQAGRSAIRPGDSPARCSTRAGRARTSRESSKREAPWGRTASLRNWNGRLPFGSRSWRYEPRTSALATKTGWKCPPTQAARAETVSARD